jgi:hypothetical protein
MTPEEINVAITEILGYRNAKFIPHFFSDLNACAEIEKTLNEGAILDYRETLSDMLKDDCRIGLGFHATAPQRCEAFLRMHGRWKE